MTATDKYAMSDEGLPLSSEAVHHKCQLQCGSAQPESLLGACLRSAGTAAEGKQTLRSWHASAQPADTVILDSLVQGQQDSAAQECNCQIYVVHNIAFDQMKPLIS